MAITCHIYECNALHYNYVMGKKCPLQITFHYFENVIYYNYITITITITPGLVALSYIGSCCFHDMLYDSTLFETVQEWKLIFLAADDERLYVFC